MAELPSTSSNIPTGNAQQPQKQEYNSISHDMSLLTLNSNLMQVENPKAEHIHSTSTISSNEPHSLLLSFENDKLPAEDKNENEQHDLSSLLNDDAIAISTVPIGDVYFTNKDKSKIESQSLIVSNQANVKQPIKNISSDSLFESVDNSSITYGVDWSKHASPTSHCWFPFDSYDNRMSHSCVFPACSHGKSKHQSDNLECGSCGLMIHAHHLQNSTSMELDLLPVCRPSFVIDQKPGNLHLAKENNSLKHDRHIWTQVSILSTPCVYCKQISKNIVEQITSVMSLIPGNLNSKISKSSRGLLCLLCSRGYHESCWQKVADEVNQTICDYGILRDIIVRPQWLIRSSELSSGFQARLPQHSADSNSESSSFPHTPVLIFINKRSGGQVGEKIYRELLRRLNPRQVFLLENNDTITHALEIYSSMKNIRICVFGGDGTVGWILGRLAEIYPSRNNPPVSICPLGTGNDLSRVLNWGEQYDSKLLFQTLLQIPQAQIVVLDRWGVQIEEIDLPSLSSVTHEHQSTMLQIKQTWEMLFKHPKFVHENNRVSYEEHHELPNTRFINYMSFGLDAAIALDFHQERTRDPSKFSSPWKNKFMYFNESCKHLSDFARANTWNLGCYICLICDGQNLTDAIRDCHTLVILNIPGYASGTNPWGKSSTCEKDSRSTEDTQINTSNSFDSFTRTDNHNESIVLKETPEHQTRSSSTATNSTDSFQRQDFGDEKVEVVGLNTARMAAIHVGFCGNRIAQCNQLRIELLSPMTAQIDGEPFYLPASVAININHAGQVRVLKNHNG